MTKRYITGECDFCFSKPNHIIHDSGRNTYLACTKHAMTRMAKGDTLYASNPGYREEVEECLIDPADYPEPTKENDMEESIELEGLKPESGEDYRSIQNKITAVNKIRSQVDEVLNELNGAMVAEMTSLAELLKKYGEDNEVRSTDAS